MTNDFWKTPNWLIEHFFNHYDPCPVNPQFNGLNTEWNSPAFVNPPYSKVIKEWVKKAIRERERGIDVVMLLRVDVSTEWYKLLVEANAHFCYFNERLHFDESKASPNFCSMLVFLEGIITNQ
jgi:peptide methionine sulfoxide reductase MsrA